LGWRLPYLQVSSFTNTVDDVISEVKAIASIFGVAERGPKVVDEINKDFALAAELTNKVRIYRQLLFHPEPC